MDPKILLVKINLDQTKILVQFDHTFKFFKLNNKIILKAKNSFLRSGSGNILKGLRFGSTSIVASHGNLWKLVSDNVSLWFLSLGSIKLACKILASYIFYKWLKSVWWRRQRLNCGTRDYMVLKGTLVLPLGLDPSWTKVIN